jgi:hypothetical protein
MTAYALTAPNGQRFLWSPEGMYMAIRSVVRANEIRSRTHIAETDQGWFMPTLYNVETRWAGLRQAVNRGSDTYWPDAEMRTRTDPAEFFRQFVTFVEGGLADQEWYSTTRRTTQHRTMQNIQNNVQNWESAITVTRGIRDGSATFLIVAGSVATGGAGAAAFGSAATAGQALSSVALGSAMRGAFTYQDTGNVGSALINASGSFVTGAIPVGAAGMSLSAAETATLVIIGSAGQGATSGLQAVAEGQSMETAATAALVSTTANLVSGGIGEGLSGAGFFVQAAAGTAMDLVTGALTNAATAPPSSPQPVPVTMGRIDFSGLPSRAAEAYVRAQCLRPI